MEDVLDGDDFCAADALIPHVRNTFIALCPPRPPDTSTRSRSVPVSSTCDRYACEVHVLMFKPRPLPCTPADRDILNCDAAVRGFDLMQAGECEDVEEVQAGVAEDNSHASRKTLVAKSAELSTSADEVFGIVGPQIDGPSDDDESTCASVATTSKQTREKEEERLDAVLAQVPRNEAGMPTSIGSMNHAMGECRPCAYFGSDQRPCQNGVRCRFCHFPHVKRKVRLYKKRRLEIRAVVEAAVASAGSHGISPPPRYVPISWSRKPAERGLDEQPAWPRKGSMESFSPSGEVHH